MLGSFTLFNRNWLIFRHPWMEERIHTPLQPMLYMSLGFFMSGHIMRSSDFVNHINQCQR